MTWNTHAFPNACVSSPNPQWTLPPLWISPLNLPLITRKRLRPWAQVGHHSSQGLPTGLKVLASCCKTHDISRLLYPPSLSAWRLNAGRALKSFESRCLCIRSISIHALRNRHMYRSSLRWSSFRITTGGRSPPDEAFIPVFTSFPQPQPLPPASAEPNALKPLQNATSLSGIDRGRLFLHCFSTLKGWGALESFSHNFTAARHWETNSKGIIGSKPSECQNRVVTHGATSRIFFINVKPYQA